jgi:serine/threonine protein phosphatase PrpC
MTAAGGRAGNQDALVVAHGPGFALLAVADGLGGHDGGAAAARCCVDTVAAAFARQPTLSDDGLRAIVDAAGSAVVELRRQQRQPSASMRSTIALLAVKDWQARWAHVGDTRVYWFRDGVLMRRTRDHNVAELVSGLADESLAAPVDAADRHRLLRAIGGAETCRAELGEAVVPLQPGDAFLLCSDGLWSLVADGDIAAALAAAASADDWCQQLRLRLGAARDGPPARKQDDYSMIAGMVED